MDEQAVERLNDKLAELMEMHCKATFACTTAAGSMGQQDEYLTTRLEFGKMKGYSGYRLEIRWK